MMSLSGDKQSDVIDAFKTTKNIQIFGRYFKHK